MALSISARRCSCSARAALLRSLVSRSVMSSCVPTQYLPPGIGLFTTEIACPSGVSTMPLTVFLCNRRDELVAIGLGISLQTAGFKSMFDDVEQRAAGLHHVTREIVH